MTSSAWSSTWDATSEDAESSTATSKIEPIAGALLAGISYYLGTRIGFTWTPVGQPNSTFWPPNAILLAALLLAPRRSWWLFLAAVLPAHMLAQLPVGVPIWTAAGWFITNSIEAVIGAYCVTRFTGSVKRLESVRGLLIFVAFAVVFAPFATSFLDAGAVVITAWGRDYWHLGMERFWTNALAELTIVPIVVLSAVKGISRIRSIKVTRWGEAALLVLGTILVAVLIFDLPALSPATTPALLFLPLPFLLWAAARFGVAGLSFALLSLALTSTWYTMHGRAPFPYASLGQNILSLQILFCMVAVPLMFLSAVMTEARHTQESLRRMSASLLEAQEQERHRIARELHDDLGQELAIIKGMLDMLSDQPNEPPTSILTELSNRVSAISETTREISHGLYPTHLEYLGFRKAVTRLCEEVQTGSKLSVQLTIGDLPDPLSPATSLCLYRVTQEALHNVITHSRAKNVQVHVTSVDGRISLRVIDDGIGFVVSHEAAGLGLASIRERIRAVGGSVSISSSPMAGTLVEVRLPFLDNCSEGVPGAV
jgi:signal transduction histidine kinase